MLMKGPVIGEWLYGGTVRNYGDSDLLVARSDWDRAVALLVQRGFRDYLAPMGHPRMESLAGTGYSRGSEYVDLHSTIDGLEAAPEDVWNCLWATAGTQEVGGRTVAVPSRPAVLMHLALHSAHHQMHPTTKPLEDLRRGIERADPLEWGEAASLADELGGLAAFAAGLRRLPEGSMLIRRLGIGEVRSVRFEVRARGVATAEGLLELLAPGLSVRRRASLVRRELVPNPRFMRWWTPLARRGTAGLLASYPLRWAWLAVNVPAGLAELRRARRRQRTI